VSEQAPPPPDSTGWRRYYTRTRAIAAGSTAAILATFALLNGTLDLFDRVTGKDSACADEHEVTLEQPTVSRLVTRGESLELDGASKAGLTKERLAEPGKRVTLHANAKGYDGDPLEIRAWVLTGNGGPVPGAELRDQLVREWTPDGCDDGTDTVVWSPIPQRAGDYSIQIQIRQRGSREALRTARSEPFPVPEPAAS
jgi:hypothetical protein